MADQPYNDENGSGRAADAAFADYHKQARDRVQAQGAPLTAGNMNAALDYVMQQAQQNPNQMVNVEDILDKFNIPKEQGMAALQSAQSGKPVTSGGTVPTPEAKPVEQTTTPAAAPATANGLTAKDWIEAALISAGAVGAGAAAHAGQKGATPAAQPATTPKQEVLPPAKEQLALPGPGKAADAPTVINQGAAPQPTALPSDNRRAFNDPINLDATGITSAPPANAKPIDYNGQKMFIDDAGTIYDNIGRKIGRVPANELGVARTIARGARAVR